MEVIKNEDGTYKVLQETIFETTWTKDAIEGTIATLESQKSEAVASYDKEIERYKKILALMK